MNFVADTFFRLPALISPDHADSRVQRATGTLFDRMLTRTARA
ncbi:hypothetical protein [Streptomyces sp. SM11]|nr:hypothetical protein [Streptomyces sp. SM11]